MVGRLASVVAKNLLQGGKVVVVRCEELNLSGHFYRNKVKYLAYLRKRCNINPARGPFHFRAPSRIFFKSVRGKFLPPPPPRPVAIRMAIESGKCVCVNKSDD